MNLPPPDFAVRREVIEKYFEPKLARSTFFDLVENGKIVRVKGLRGYYRLNESLRRLGLPSVQQPKIDRSSGNTVSDQAIADIALSSCMPDQLPAPSELLCRELSADVILKVARLRWAYSEALAGINAPDERLHFAQGVRDAAALMAFVAEN